MPRQTVPFAVSDISAFAKSLRSQLVSRPAPPGHLELLNMLARATGHRNFQHLRAGLDGGTVAGAGSVPRADDAAVLRAARYFDPEGRLRSWPARTSVQNLCLWVIWSRIPRGAVFDERALNRMLAALHLFGDHAILRRTMRQLGMLERTPDGREYRRVEQAPPGEALLLIRSLRGGPPLPGKASRAPAAPMRPRSSGDRRPS